MTRFVLTILGKVSPVPCIMNGSNTSLFLQQMPLQTHLVSHLSFSWLSPTGTLSLPRTPSCFSSSVISRWWAPVKLGKAEGSAAQRTAPTASLYLRLLRERRRHKWVCNSCHSSCYSKKNPVNASHSHSLSNPWEQDQATSKSIFWSTEHQLQEGSQRGRKKWENISGVIQILQETLKLIWCREAILIILKSLDETS